MRPPLRFGALLLALTCLSAPAFADGRWDGHGRDGRDGRHGDSHRDHDRSRYDNRRDAYRHGYRYGYRDGYRDDRRVVYRPVYHDRYYVAPRPVFYGPRPAYYGWTRGGRYYGRGYRPTYVVNDYYGYGLRRPPPGYYWRRSDAGDFLLVALTTGIIADLVLHH